MTVPNLFCQRAVSGEALQVLEDRPMAFIHVQDAAAGLLAAPSASDGRSWRRSTPRPEVATIGQLARTVQRLMQARGGAVEHPRAPQRPDAHAFRCSRVLDAEGFSPQRTLADGLAKCSTVPGTRSR